MNLEELKRARREAWKRPELRKRSEDETEKWIASVDRSKLNLLQDLFNSYVKYMDSLFSYRLYASKEGLRRELVRRGAVVKLISGQTYILLI